MFLGCCNANANTPENSRPSSSFLKVVELDVAKGSLGVDVCRVDAWRLVRCDKFREARATFGATLNRPSPESRGVHVHFASNFTSNKIFSNQVTQAYYAKYLLYSSIINLV